MFRNNLSKLIYLSIFICFSVVVAEQAEINTTTAIGGDQIVVFPINIILDLGESGYASALVIDKDGNPVEGRKIQIIPQDKTKVAIEGNSFITDRSGYIHFSMLGKQEGDTVVTVSDGTISSHINIAIRNLIHYALPYFSGNMHVNLINPTDNINYVKIQFHENSDRLMPPVTMRLEGKEMKTLKLSEELEVELRDGWLEISSTEIVCGGVWTNKGYLPFNPVKESHQ